MRSNGDRYCRGQLSEEELTGDALEAMAMPERSARRQISLMRAEGLLVSDNKSAPLRWAIPEHAEPWLFPDLFK